MIPLVDRGRLIAASHQNTLIEQVNQNSADIVDLKTVPGGDVEPIKALIAESVSAHEVDSTPHPAYDDLPSLSIIFENGLV